MEASVSENRIPNTLPVNGQDRFEYILKYEIQAVTTFDQHLDVDILKKAVRLSLDAEPVLGCRFIEDEKQPYWQRFERPDEMQWFEFVTKDNKKEATQQFLKSPFTHDGQQVNVRLIRTEDGDTLCIKISHACSDAAGLKEYLDLLAGIYSNLQKNSIFKPNPNQGRRDQKHYFDALGVKEPLALFDPQAQVLPPTWAFPHHGVEKKEMHIAMRRFRDGAFDRIVNFGENRKVTITSVILTALYRSMFELLKPPIGEEMGICVTVDLRKAFIGSPDQAICNLSVGIYPRITRVEEESFTETLQRVSSSIEVLKNDRAGLLNAIGLEVWGTIDYSQTLSQMQAIIQWTVETDKSHPLLSNVGVINPLQFGQIVATDAYIVTPIVVPPGFMLGVSTYNKTLTLEVSFCEPSHRTEDVEAFMDLMEKELSSL
ncbi:MAG: hypothetical protein CVU90_03710 [Firmicutes bacterium HGW-Firmicutes-15]|nr:MAG: hypothetical protein CVU90_03710 [Firmicutes bacterium HGW-Firmicutes-15]